MSDPKDKFSRIIQKAIGILEELLMSDQPLKWGRVPT